MTQGRELDVLVWGATGFTGRLVAEYLHQQYGSTLRWGMGGRSEAKLERVRSSLGGGAESIPIVTGDSHDPKAMGEIADRATVICSTVGPFALHGSPLVAACAQQGTHYCDITGEAQWVKQMIDAHQSEAVNSGARIINCCGFDSIPSDLGVWFMQQRMQELHERPCSEVKLRVRKIKGAASGGTVASMLNLVAEARRNRAVARTLVDPYGLNPPDSPRGPDGRDQTGPLFDPDLGAWTAPFVMAAINGKVVRRTNALLDFPYGKDFRYSEAVITGRGAAGLAKAVSMSASLAALVTGARFDGSRRLLERFVLPKSGEGPDERLRESGFFNLVLVGILDGNPTVTLKGRVRGKRDPGYGATCRMLAESAVCLAEGESSVEGGFWTPAAAMAEPLMKRLAEKAEISFSLD